MPELIDREQAGKNICKYCASNAYCKEDDCMVYQGLRDTPTIQIEAEPVRHGRWKKKNGEIYCTNCKKSKWSKSFELMLRGFDFCPKCGADMREGGADNDSE